MKNFAISQVAAVMFLVPVTTFSQDNRQLTPAQVTERVQAKVESYADALTCSTETMEGSKFVLHPKMIAALAPYKPDAPQDSDFVGFWLGDMGCMGGSGTMSFHLVSVNVNYSGNFYGDAYASQPAITVDG